MDSNHMCLTSSIPKWEHQVQALNNREDNEELSKINNHLDQSKITIYLLSLWNLIYEYLIFSKNNIFWTDYS